MALVIGQGYFIIIEWKNTLRSKNVAQPLCAMLELPAINLGLLLLMERPINGSVVACDELELETAEQYYKDIRANLTKTSSLSDALKDRTNVIEKLLMVLNDSAVRIAKDFICSKINILSQEPLRSSPLLAW